MKSETVAERLARHVAAAQFEDVSPDAVAACKTFLLDSLGVAVAGARLPDAARLRQAARHWGQGRDAGVPGTALRLPAPSAALVSAYQLHGQEFDCVHEAAVVHPMAVLLPAALALAERQGGGSGRDFLLALILGVDVAVTLGLAARAPLSFFRPATAGAFGAVAAIGKLAGFDAARLVDAFGLIYAQLSGTMQAHLEGKPVLAMQAGFNARNAVAACDLAAAGVAGTAGTFEGRFGYLPLYERDFALGGLLDTLGTIWRIAEVSHKPFPSGRATHGAIDGLLQLRARHRLAAADIASATVTVPPLVAQLCGRPDIPDPAPSYARLCIPCCGAVALLRGAVGLGDFTPAALADPAVHALAARISVAIDGNSDPNALRPQHVAVTTTGGTRHEIALLEILGSPARPLSRAQHLAKFRAGWAAAGLAPDAAETAIAMVDRLDAETNIGSLISVLVV